MKWRPWVIRLHRWIGLTMGLVVAVVSLTGAILTFEPELDHFFYSDLWTVEAGTTRISPAAALRVLREEAPERRVVMLRTWTDPTRSYAADLVGGLQVFVDPYSGDVLGKRVHSRTLFGRTMSLHRSLLAGEAGRKLVTIATIAMVLLIGLGLIVWWPGSKRLARRGLLLRLRRGWKKVNYDLHNVMGFYASLYLLLLSLTGIILGMPVLRTIAERLVYGDRAAVASQERQTPPAATPLPTGREASDETGPNFDRILERADQEIPGAIQTNLALPPPSGGPIRVVRTMPDAPFPSAKDVLYFDDATSDLLRVERYADWSTGKKLDRLVFPIHAGSVLGWPTRVLAALVSLVAATLPITGAIIWFPRWRARRARRGRRSPGDTTNKDT